MKQMNEINQVQDDEIDFFELFQTLWDGKWLISAFVAIAVLLGGGYILWTDAVYQTKIFLSVNSSVPPNKKQIQLKPLQQSVYIDFQSKFYTEKSFEDWKESNSNTSLVFTDLSKTEIVDGFILSKNKGERLVTFEVDKLNKTFILVNSNQLTLALDVFKYANHINKILKRDYVYQAKYDLKNTDALLKNGASVNASVIETILSINAFIDLTEKGATILTIERPTKPKKISPNYSLILYLSVILSGIIGAIYVLISNAIRKRKEQFANA
jgi:capsular polysaccharide biosynthesis protein